MRWASPMTIGATLVLGVGLWLLDGASRPGVRAEEHAATVPAEYLVGLEGRVQVLEQRIEKLTMRLEIAERLLQLEVKERHPLLRSMEKN